MKIKLKTKLGRFLMKISKIKICIIDDEEIYFNETHLNLAKINGFGNIERFYQIDSELFSDLQKTPWAYVELKNATKEAKVVEAEAPAGKSFTVL